MGGSEPWTPQIEAKCASPELSGHIRRVGPGGNVLRSATPENNAPAWFPGMLVRVRLPTS